jgi:hypothetical protein
MNTPRCSARGGASITVDQRRTRSLRLQFLEAPAHTKFASSMGFVEQPCPAVESMTPPPDWTEGPYRTQKAECSSRSRVWND